MKKDKDEWDKIQEEQKEAEKFTQEQWDNLIDEEDEDESIPVRPGQEEYINDYDPDEDDDDGPDELDFDQNEPSINDYDDDDRVCF